MTLSIPTRKVTDMKINTSERLKRADEIIKALNKTQATTSTPVAIRMNGVNLLMMAEYLNGEADNLELETSVGTERFGVWTPFVTGDDRLNAELDELQRLTEDFKARIEAYARAFDICEPLWPEDTGPVPPLV